MRHRVDNWIDEYLGRARRTKFPTITQYTNCSTPTTTKNAKNESSNLTRCGVLSTYLFQTSVTIACASIPELPDLEVLDLAGALADVEGWLEGTRCLGGMVGDVFPEDERVRGERVIGRV